MDRPRKCRIMKVVLSLVYFSTSYASGDVVFRCLESVSATFAPQVVCEVSGSLDTSGLATTTGGITSNNGQIRGDDPVINVGVGLADVQYQFSPLGGPSTIGGGTGVLGSSSSTGQKIGFFAEPSSNRFRLYMPSGYTSNSALSGSSIWNNATLSSLGISSGTYTWNIDGTQQVRFTTVPEPSAVIYLVLLITLVAGQRWADKRVVAVATLRPS